MKVFVYFNLHKKLFSIKALEGPSKGRVIGHEEYILLKDATFKVSEAGRQRVLREKRKNVHAGVVGDWSGITGLDIVSRCKVPVTYNPYKYKSFVNKDTETPIQNAGYAYLSNKKILIA